MEAGVLLDQEAIDKDKQQGRHRKSNLVMLHRRYTRKSKYTPKVPAEDPGKRENNGAKYKAKKLHELDLEDKIAIVHSCIVDKETVKDAARKHSVKPRLVQCLVSKAKKNKRFLADLRAVREEVQ